MISFGPTRQAASRSTGAARARLLLLALLAVSPSAQASPNYTQTIQDSLGLDCPPRCTLCHQDNQGGTGTIRPGSFGEAVVYVAELGQDDEAKLRCALQLLEPGCEEPPPCAAPEQTCFIADTDADGLTDIDELRQLRNPNTSGEGVLCGASYGCGAELTASPVPEQQPPMWATVAAGILALRAIQRSKRKRAKL